MNFENKIKDKLLTRGFTKEQLLNNRGLIGAVIDETILMQASHIDKFLNWINSFSKKRNMKFTPNPEYKPADPMDLIVTDEEGNVLDRTIKYDGNGKYTVIV